MFNIGMQEDDRQLPQAFALSTHTLCYNKWLPFAATRGAMSSKARYPRSFALVRDGEEPVILIAETDADYHR